MEGFIELSWERKEPAPGNSASEVQNWGLKEETINFREQKKPHWIKNCNPEARERGGHCLIIWKKIISNLEFWCPANLANQELEEQNLTLTHAILRKLHPLITLFSEEGPILTCSERREMADLTQEQKGAIWSRCRRDFRHNCPRVGNESSAMGQWGSRSARNRNEGIYLPSKPCRGSWEHCPVWG